MRRSAVAFLTFLLTIPVLATTPRTAHAQGWLIIERRDPPSPSIELARKLGRPLSMTDVKNWYEGVTDQLDRVLLEYRSLRRRWRELDEQAVDYFRATRDRYLRDRWAATSLLLDSDPSEAWVGDRRIIPLRSHLEDIADLADLRVKSTSEALNIINAMKERTRQVQAGLDEVRGTLRDVKEAIRRQREQQNKPSRGGRP
jgi:hypothetical protein